MSDNLTPLAQLLLDTLKAGGDWMTRLEIAKAMGRPVLLSAYDIKVLNKLAEMGLIEIDQRTIGLVKKEYIYRAK